MEVIDLKTAFETSVRSSSQTVWMEKRSRWRDKFGALESERNARTEAEIEWEKRCHASGFEGGGRGHMSSSVGQTGEQTVPRSRQKECSSVHTLIFAQRDRVGLVLCRTVRS